MTIRGFERILAVVLALLLFGGSGEAASQCDFNNAVTTGLKHRWLHNPDLYPNGWLDCKGGTNIGPSTTGITFEDVSGTVPPVKAAMFDGAGASMIFPSSGVAALGASDLTFAFWVQTTKAGSQHLFGNAPMPEMMSDSIHCVTSGTELDFIMNDGMSPQRVKASWAAIKDGNWHHIAIVRSPSRVAVYYDGAHVSTGSGPGSNPTVGYAYIEMRIGGQGTDPAASSYYFQGQMDDFRIYTAALSAADITKLYKENRRDGYQIVTLNDGKKILARLSDLGDAQCIASSEACVSATSETMLWSAVDMLLMETVADPLNCTAFDYDGTSWCHQAQTILGGVIPARPTTTIEPTSTTETTSTETTETTSTESETMTTTTTQWSTTTEGFTRTSTTTRTNAANCYVAPFVCDNCNTTDPVYVNNASHAQLVFGSAQYQFFQNKVVGSANAVFGLMPDGFPPLIMASPELGETRMCFQMTNTTTVTIGTVLDYLRLNYSLCTACLGSLNDIKFTTIALAMNQSHILAAEISVSIPDLTPLPNITLTKLGGTLNYARDNGYQLNLTGKVNASAWAQNGPQAVVVVNRTALYVDMSFSGLNWGFWKLAQTLGVINSVQLPDPDVQYKVENAFSLKSITGIFCGRNQGNTTACADTFTIVATILAGDIIKLDGGFFTLTGVQLEATYSVALVSKAKTFTFQISAYWLLAGQKLSVTAGLEVSKSRKRAVIFDSTEGRIRYPDRGTPEAADAEQALQRLYRPPLQPRATSVRFFVKVESPKLPIGDVISKLAFPVAPSELGFVTTALSKIQIANFLMEASFDPRNKQYMFRIVGSPTFIPNSRFELVAGSLEGKRMAAGLVFISSGSFSSINDLLSGLGSKVMDLTKTPVKSQSGPAVFAMISTRLIDLDKYQLWKWTTPGMGSETEIPKGLTVAADMGFPADCAGDTICTTFKGFLGEARLRVGINAQPSQFSVSAMLVDLKINDELKLNKVGFQLILGGKNRLGIVGELRVNVTKTEFLTFGAEVAAVFDGPKVEFKGYMVGLWSNAFGIPRFAVGNLVFALGVTATSPVLGLPMPAFIIGGEIAVGPQPCYSTPPAPTYSCPAWTVEEKKLLSDKQQDVINGGPGSTERLLCANLRTRTYQYDAQFSPCKCRCCELVTTTPASVCFGAAGYVGIDPSNPKENWFYVQTKNLVVQNITNAFIDGAPKLPSVIAETGFPGTNTFSFSMVAEQTPIKGVTVPRGIYFKGAFNLFGYKGRAEVAIDPGNGFLLDAEVDPLIIGGDIFVLTRNSSVRNYGPYVYIDARGLKMLLPTIKGSAFLSLFGGVAKAEVIIDIVMPNRLNIYARIDLWVLGAEVNITSELSLSGWPKMSVGAYVEFNGMDAAQKFATKVISEISGFAKKSSQDLANAGKDVQVKKREAQAALAKVCDREACITKVREWGCANWAKKIRCANKKECYWFEIGCHFENLGALFCAIAKQIIEWVCQAWDWIINTYTNEICAVACGVASAASEVASFALDVATGVLDGLSNFLTFLGGLLDWLAKGLQVFSISRLNGGVDFRVDGFKLSKGLMYCNIQGTLFNRPWKTAFEIDLADLLGSAARLIKSQIVPVMKGLWGRRRSMRTIGSSLGTGEGVESGSLLPDFLRDPAIRAYLGNGTYYVGTHEIMGQEVPIVLDMRYLPEGIDGFLNRTYEYQGETPHRTKWDGPKLQKRREMSELWEPDPLQGEAFLAHLDRSFSVGM